LDTECGSKRITSDVDDLGVLWVDQTVAVDADVPENPGQHAAEGEYQAKGGVLWVS
jgi:hypothetical protein